MHEFSLMRDVIGILRSSAVERGIERIESIRMTVGSLSCAFPPALETAFNALSQGDPLLEKARLDIFEQDIVIRCESCGTEAELGGNEFVCRGCCDTAVSVIRGDELVIDSYRGR